MHKAFHQTSCTRSFSSLEQETLMHDDPYYQKCPAEEHHAQHKVWAITSSSSVVHKGHRGFCTLFLFLYLPTPSHIHENSYIPRQRETLIKTSVIQCNTGGTSLSSWNKEESYSLSHQNVCPIPSSPEAHIQRTLTDQAVRKPPIKLSQSPYFFWFRVPSLFLCIL